MSLTKTPVDIINTTDADVTLYGNHVRKVLKASPKPAYVTKIQTHPVQLVKGMAGGMPVAQPREVMDLPAKKANVRYFVSSEVFNELKGVRDDLYMADRWQAIKDADGKHVTAVVSLLPSGSRKK